MSNKVDVMKELLDRYEQIGSIKDEHIASIVKRYIQQLEIELAIELVGEVMDNGK